VLDGLRVLGAVVLAGDHLASGSPHPGRLAPRNPQSLPVLENGEQPPLGVGL
jgi:hypothetical protein